MPERRVVLGEEGGKLHTQGSRGSEKEVPVGRAQGEWAADRPNGQGPVWTGRGEPKSNQRRKECLPRGGNLTREHLVARWSFWGLGGCPVAEWGSQVFSEHKGGF